MNFEVNNVTYFLAFNDEEGGWMLLTPVRNGFRRIAVYDDDAQLVTFAAPQSSPGDHQPVN
jgi:hypothetical protein